MSVTESKVEDFRGHHDEREIGDEKTMDDYIRWIRRFELWRGPDVDEDELRQFDSFLDDDDRIDYPWENRVGRPAPDSYAYQTRVKAASALKYWLPWEYDTDVSTKVQDICKGEPEPFDPHIIPQEEIRRAIENAPNDCNAEGCQAAAQLGYDAIMRGAEVAHARREDVDLANGSLYVRAVKGSNNATISLSERTMQMLRAHIESTPEREYLFHNTYSNPWTPNAFNKHFREFHHDAGSHSFFRHSPIAHRLNGGEDFGAVFRRCRHVYPSQTAEYGRVVDVDVADWAGAGGE